MSWIKNFALGTLSFAACYCLLVIGDWYIHKNITQQLDQNPDYSRAKNIEKLRRKNEDFPLKELALKEGFSPTVYPSLMDRLNLHHPLIAGLPNTNTFLCNEGYGLIKYRSDRFGFRNNNEDWDIATKRIMIGDSFVHGACVSSDQTLPAILEKSINGIVLNLGIGSNNPSHYLTYSELFIPKIRPSHVYLVFYANDNGIKSRSIIEKVYVSEKRELFSNEGLGLVDTEVFISEGYKAIETIKKEDQDAKNKLSKKFFSRAKNKFLIHFSLPIIRGLVMPSSASFEQTKKAIYSTHKLCETYECILTIVFIPNSHFWAPDSRADQYGNDIQELGNFLNLQVIDGREILDRSEGSKDYAIKGPHLSPNGYKKLATTIASAANAFD